MWWAPTGHGPNKFRMQFKNTSDTASQTDTNQHNVGGELHAKLLWPGRRRSLASLRDDAPSHPSAHRAALMWRAPEGPEGLAGLRGDVQAHISDTAPPVWRAPKGLVGLAAVPVGGGGAWPGFETTRRAKLAARTTRGRAAAHGRIKQPGPTAGPDGARNTGLKDKKSWSEPDLSALRCEKVWFKVVGGQL